MVFLFGINPLLATSYSLFIVGSTSLVGAINHYRNGHVNLKAAIYLGAASIITVFLTRKFIIPLIPEKIATIDGFTIKESLLTMLLFAVLMLLASISMIRNKTSTVPQKEGPEYIRILKLIGFGVAIGLITGLLGAGGGFLLIPALVFLVRLPIKQAIGTSLLIISLNSLIGFTGDLGHITIGWNFLLVITSIAIVGIFIGGIISKYIPAENLKKSFGWFVLVMGVYIIAKEILG